MADKVIQHLRESLELSRKMIDLAERGAGDARMTGA